MTKLLDKPKDAIMLITTECGCGCTISQHVVDADGKHTKVYNGKCRKEGASNERE